MALGDDSLMTFGKFQGEKLANVEASYLLWLREQWDERPPTRADQIELARYIEDNLEVLRMERSRRK